MKSFCSERALDAAIRQALGLHIDEEVPTTRSVCRTSLLGDDDVGAAVVEIEVRPATSGDADRDQKKERGA